MKKYILGILLVSLITMASCGKDDDELSNKSCEELEQEVSLALSKYSLESTTAHCIAYRSLLQAQLDKGCEEGNESFIQRIISNLNCN